MKAIVLVATLLLAFAFSGVASAMTPPDESSATLDLTPAGGPIVYLMCSYGTSLSNCQNPTLWEESNGLRGLQHLGYVTKAKVYPPDSRLLA